MTTPALLYCEFCEEDIGSMKIEAPAPGMGSPLVGVGGKSLLMMLWAHLQGVAGIGRCPALPDGESVVIAICHPEPDDEEKLSGMEP